MKPVGPTIKRFLEESRVKQADIADKTGISRSQLSAMLTKEVWSTDMLEKVCLAVGLSPATFFDIEDGKIVNYSDIKDSKAPINIGNKSVRLGSADSRILEAKNEVIATKDALIAAKDEIIKTKDELLKEKEDKIRSLQPASETAPNPSQEN